MSKIENIDNERYLQKFLLDIDCLHKLSLWTNKFNLFDILKISKAEIRHSNVLAWLLDPNENHNLKDYIVRGLFEIIIKRYNSKDINVFDILLMNFNDLKVLREWKNIDIMLVCETNKVVVCIENKVCSHEHSDQLNRYQKTIKEHYKTYTKLFLFLTPQGENASDSDTWINISYIEIVDLIEKAVLKITLPIEAELLITNYIDTVRWHIVGDVELIKICNEIYKKHKKALDLIYENKIDNIQEISDYICEYISSYSKKDYFRINEQKCSKTYIRFTTEKMSVVLPNRPNETSGWKTCNYYFYEIRNSGKNLRLQLCISRGDFTEDEYIDYYDKLFQVCGINDVKDNWTWKTVESWSILKYNDGDTLEELEEMLIEKLEDVLFKVCEFEEKFC